MLTDVQGVEESSLRDPQAEQSAVLRGDAYAAAPALESRVKCLVRAAVGSPVALGQALVLADLESPTVEEEIAELRAELVRCIESGVRALRAGS